MHTLTLPAWDAAAGGRVLAAGRRPDGPTTGRLVNEPDQVELRAAQPGRQFESFYRDAFDGVYRALALSFGDADLAHEATSEAMARCYQRWRRIQGYDNPAGWVYRVGLNWGRSRIARRRRDADRAHRLDRTGQAPPPDVVAGDPELDAALRSLDLKYRSVVVLRYLCDWSEAETAEALHVPAGTVKSRLSRGLDQLRQRLEAS
jgi:RNA polymerase sigma-70 factor (ECF subfamily)